MEKVAIKGILYAYEIAEIADISQPEKFDCGQKSSFSISDCHHDVCLANICPDNLCPYQQYLSCYWQNFDQTLNKGSWEHIEHITTVNTTFVQATFTLGTFVHILAISQLSKLNTFDFGLVMSYDKINENGN